MQSNIKAVAMLSVLVLLATHAAAADLRIGETKQEYISVVNQRVDYPGNRTGEVVYEAETGWVIVSYEVVEHHKYGQSGWSVEKLAAGSDFITEQRIREVIKELTDYTREQKKDDRYRERLEKLRDYLLEANSRVKASHSRLTVKWQVKHGGNPFDRKGGSMHLALRVNLARALLPVEATKMVTELKAAIRKGDDLGVVALQFKAPKKSVGKAADLIGTGVLKTVHGRTVVATHHDEGFLMKQQTLECTPPNGGWSRLTIIALGGEDVLIKTVHGRFVVATHYDEGWIIKQQEERFTPPDGGWSRFTVVPKADGKFLLKTVHGRYIVAAHGDQGWILSQATAENTPENSNWSLLELTRPD